MGRFSGDCLARLTGTLRDINTLPVRQARTGPVAMDIASIRNYYERAVFSTILQQVEHHPHLQGNDDVLADIACVALNRLPPRYIRHEVDLAFFQTERERSEFERSVEEAVEFAFGFVQARNAMRARR